MLIPEVSALRAEDRKKQMVTSRKQKRAERSLVGGGAFTVSSTWPAEMPQSAWGQGCSNGIMVEEMVAGRADFVGDSEIL